MNTEIITIGDELLIGQVVDTNSAWMGEQLEKEGFPVVWKTTVGDVGEHLLEAIDKALSRSQIVLLTGGIGPTKDDITRDTLCRYFNSELHFSEEVYADIKRLFEHSGRKINTLTRNQAMVPDACTVIRNYAGTAPCTWFEREGRVLVSMPGVPIEMKWLMMNEVIPRLKSAFHSGVYIHHHTLWVEGYSESELALALKDFEMQLPSYMKLAYLPQAGVVRLRLSAFTGNDGELSDVIAGQHVHLHRLLAGHILSEEDRAPEEMLGRKLLEQGLTVGTAESCTGGRIASLITSIPGSSHYYKGSVIAYANDVKCRVLGVKRQALRSYGAVSRQVVEQMAMKAIRTLECDCAIATSGIAGPDGGTPDKPVGTVWIAAAYGEQLLSTCYQFGTLREMTIVRASNTALIMLLRLLNE
ncbi:MAG: CinA family nicotinamide mononucleotide deamidase-related protein [Tannerellaceae bacterium]|jgi:nicotinamide-nucleotide amidase|nr:CinA family nicotinamide mononucleotide deamidase-related protein [Tannerellaceae bacterium]